MSILKPPTKTRVVPLLQEIHGIALSRVGEEALIASAAVESEGSIDKSERDELVYRGSTFLTIDFRKLNTISWPDNLNPDNVLGVIKRSLRFRVRLIRLARKEAERRCEPNLLTGMFVETEFKIEDLRLLVDINIECPLVKQRVRESLNNGGKA